MMHKRTWQYQQTVVQTGQHSTMLSNLKMHEHPKGKNMQNLNEELQAIQRKHLLISLIGAPGAILLGLGLYGVFAAHGDAFIPLLNDIQVSYTAIAVGAVLMIAEFLAIMKLISRKNALMKQAKS